MIVHQMHKSDNLQNLLDLYTYLHPDEPVLQVNAEVQQIWDTILNNPDIYYIVAESDGKFVATCNITVIPNLTRGARPYGLIENVVTHPNYRKKGIGTQILKFALQIAWERDCYKVMLNSGRKDEDTLTFYDNAGFLRGVKTAFVAKPKE